MVDTLKLSPEMPTTPNSRPPLSPEFRCQLVDLVLAGRDPDDLAREFGPTGQSIRAWVAKSSQKGGRQWDATVALAAPDREQFGRLQRDNKQLRLERDELSNPWPGLPARPARSHPDRPGHEREPGHIPSCCDGTCARRIEGGFLRVAASPAMGWAEAER